MMIKMETDILRNTEKRFMPSGLNSHFHFTHQSFAEYVLEMREIIEHTRLDLNSANAELIIDANSPFEWIPPRTEIDPKSNKFRNGILLIHGLFDSPYIMQSLASYFIKKGFLVRAILLPGHGTIPGDLLEISYHDWVKATEFGIASFTRQVDKLYVAGFSTGAALALHYAYHYDHLAGLLLFSPAIRLRTQFAVMSNLNDLMMKTIGGKTWYIKSGDTDYAKYKSFTFNSGHQVYLLTKQLSKLHKQKQLPVPIFMALSADDEVISSKASVDFFQKTQHPSNQLLYYATKPLIVTDPRIQYINSAFTKYRILNFSHICLAIAPNHPHYGIHSDYHDFHHYELPYGKFYKNKIQRAQFRPTQVYAGAISRKNLTKYYIKRLTYNPDFNHMLQCIAKFMGGG